MLVAVSIISGAMKLTRPNAAGQTATPHQWTW